MLKFVKVTGQSLSPDYQEGDYVMLITLPFFPFKRGNTIVFQHPDYGVMIKKIAVVSAEGITVTGTHPHSVDSRRFGSIQRDSVIGVVVWHIRRQGV